MKKRFYNQYQKELIGDNPKLSAYLLCKDHTVSRETFELIHEERHDMLITFPQPRKVELPSYYESEEYISHTDSKNSVMDRVYQLVRKYSLKKKLRVINKLSSVKGELLDIGCGTGDFLKTCEGNGWTVSGVEPNQGARMIAEKKLDSRSLVVEEVDELLKNSGSRYDVITLWHVLEHVPDLMDFIEKLKELLNPDGILIIAVPNFKSFDANYYKEYWAAFDVPRHLWHFSEKSIASIFSRFNFEVHETMPMKFDSFYVSLLSEKYKTGSSNLFRAFWVGLSSNLKAKRSGAYSSLIYLVKNSN